MFSGCKVDAETGDGVTALHVAVIKNYIDIVKILIKAGSNVNHKTYDSMTPLHFATSRGFLDSVSTFKQLIFKLLNKNCSNH